MAEKKSEPMGIRERIEERPGFVAAGVAVAMIFASVMLWRGGGFGNSSSSEIAPSFYSSDDGKTYFTDASNLLTPFIHDGKEAVRAVVFSCDGGKTRFVGYLMRLNPTTKSKVDQILASSGQKADVDQIISSGTEIKLPGETTWHPLRSAEGMKLMQVQPPAGQTGEPKIMGP